MTKADVMTIEYLIASVLCEKVKQFMRDMKREEKPIENLDKYDFNSVEMIQVPKF